MDSRNTTANAEPAFVIEATQDNFETEVIHASTKTPVLVDLWAEWCGPCKSLGPILEKLAAEYNGAFILAKVDVDKEQALAGMFGVRSIPTVVLIKDGQAADGFAGAKTEGEIREFLDKHVEKPGIIGADAGGGDTSVPGPPEPPEQAVTRIRQEMSEHPDDKARVFDLAQALLRADQLDEARKELAGLPANLETDARARRLRDQIGLAESLGDAPPAAELRARLDKDPNDHEARDLLGVRLLMEGNAEAGLEQFLALLEADRDWNEGQARKRLVAAFSMLDDAELVGRYRRRMSTLLF
ncbi:MAG: thioredoxin [Rhodanobacteraceae bacterium]